MPASLKVILKYVLILGAVAFLIWFSLRGIQVEPGQDKWDFLVNTWAKAHKGWLALMAFFAVISHIIRAERWRMLMVPTGHSVTLVNSFLSLMIGYLINLVVPRGGEVSRCYNLYKLDGTPVETSFGTVVVERLADLLCLVLLLVISFFVEYDKLMTFIDTLPWSSGNHQSKIGIVVLGLAVMLVVALVCYLFFKRNERFRGLVLKAWGGFRAGLLSVFRLDKKYLFVFYSVSIWALYFLMSYCVIKAFPQTAFLGFGAVLSLFAIGSIAMAAPLPGGAGSYHVLVPQGLVFLYNVPQSDAVAFTFIFHGWQTAIMIVMGALALVISSMRMRSRN